MNIINSNEKLDNIIEVNGGYLTNFNQKKVVVKEINYKDDGIEEEVEKEVYRIYQHFTKRIPTLRERKEIVLEGINHYDKSNAVNTFKYDGRDYWLDRETRVSVMNTTTILKAFGEETATLWVGNTELTLPCDTIIGILATIEKYALSCYNVTQRHKCAVSSMSLEEAYEYDFEVGYPTPIEFNI